MQQLFENISQHLLHNDFLAAEEKLFIRILFEYNLRFSELKNSKWKFFFKNKYFLIEGKKKSENIVIRDKSILNAITNIPRSASEFIFPVISYKRIYDVLKSQYSHLIPTRPNRKNQPVTHASRYNAVSKSIPEDFNRLILHHKSNKTQKYYLR